ncbi:MAG TPA: plastocyanin/azurin family copper-binding protein [Nitrososphaeraceae archaeon]
MVVHISYHSHYYSYSYSYSYFVTLLLASFLFFLFYSLDNNTNNIYAQKEDKNNATRIHIVTIPKGSANPSIDITNLEERKWYNPSKLKIESGEIVKWINNDRESHTVTSGVGSGIQSLLTNKLGTANGIFDSGLFAPGESWSYNFTNKIGIFSYFCTLHPWMTAVVDVKESQKDEQEEEREENKNKIIPIPDYPVDDKGNKLSRFPVHTLSNDEKYDIDMSWSPKVLQTNKPSTFLIDFFEMPSNKKLHLVPYDIVIIQNNKTLEKASGITEVGADTIQYTFSEPGPITVRIENIGDTEAYTEFNTLVYQNPDTTSSSISKSESNKQKAGGGIISPVGQFSTGLISPIFLVTLVYAIIIAIPATAAVVIVLYKKGII